MFMLLSLLCGTSVVGLVISQTILMKFESSPLIYSIHLHIRIPNKGKQTQYAYQESRTVMLVNLNTLTEALEIHVYVYMIRKEKKVEKNSNSQKRKIFIILAVFVLWTVWELCESSWLHLWSLYYDYTKICESLL